MSIAAAATLPVPSFGPETMEALRFLLDGSLTETPERRSGSGKVTSLNDLAWCFVAADNEFHAPHCARTFKTLEQMLGANSHFTPNTFFSRKWRKKDALRWLNCLFADIDIRGCVYSTCKKLSKTPGCRPRH